MGELLVRASRFNLVDEPWIPVVQDGNYTLQSLTATLTRAGTLSELAPDLPTGVPALLRQVLVPTVLDALGPITAESAWVDLFRQGDFTDPQKARLTAYLTRHRDRFELFHGSHPFAQAGGLRSVGGDIKTAALLVPLEATGRNVPLFSSHTDAHSPALTAAQAAQWLLHTHCWDAAGIKTGAVGDPQVRNGKTTGNPVAPLGQVGVVVPTGRTLFDTLVLNLPIEPDGRSSDDVPQWRRGPADVTWRSKPAAGLLDLLTWQSRRIHLFPGPEDGADQVQGVIVAAGDRLAAVPEYDPHVAWRTDTYTGERRPHRHLASRFWWQGRDATLIDLVATPLVRQAALLRSVNAVDAAYPLRVDGIGLTYGSQSSIVQDSVADKIRIPVDALTSHRTMGRFVLDIAAQAAQLVTEAERLLAEHRHTAGGESSAKSRGPHIGAAVGYGLDRHVHRLLDGLQREPSQDLDRARKAWRQASRQSVLGTVRPYLATLEDPSSAERRLATAVNRVLAERGHG